MRYILSQFLTPIKNVGRIPISFGVWASKTWPFCGACKNFRAQHPLGAEIWSSE